MNNPKYPTIKKQGIIIIQKEEEEEERKHDNRYRCWRKMKSTEPRFTTVGIPKSCQQRDDSDFALMLEKRQLET